MLVKDVTDLEVYNESLRLLKKLYELLKKIPISEHNIILQCKKCGTSIPANVAEGWAKRIYPAEFKRFLYISIGSSDELVNHLRIIGIILPHLLSEADELGVEYKILSKRLNKLHSNWQTR